MARFTLCSIKVTMMMMKMNYAAYRLIVSYPNFAVLAIKFSLADPKFRHLSNDVQFFSAEYNIGCLSTICIWFIHI